MAWIERPDKRKQRNKTFQDSEDPTKFAIDATLATLHYETEIDSDVFDAPIDVNLISVNNAQLDGWEVTLNGWHYFLGRDLLNHGNTDGWVGFGGRKGQAYFKYRLARVGYLHWPTKVFDDVDGPPDYKRQNLTLQTNEIQFATDGSAQPIESVVNWADIWKTPVGGSLSVSWRINGDGLKEEITINQAGREWIAANRPPVTPANETYFGFIFQLDWSSIPKVYRQGLLQNIEGDFTDDGESIEMKDALDRLLAFMPISDVRVPNADPELDAYCEPLRKRIYKDGSDYYLLLGVHCDVLNAMPAGDLIFDPTVDKQINTTENDGYYTSAAVWVWNTTPTNNYVGFSGGNSNTVGLRWPDVVVSGNIAYVAHEGNGDGFKILDVSNPNSVTEIATHPNTVYSYDLFLRGNLIYLANGGRGLKIIDVSSDRQAIGMEGKKEIIVALLGKKLFEDRMLFRKEEEIKLVKGEKRESSMPIVWMFIDEAHMFMPKDEDNLALKVLLEWVRVGRQPGLSLVLATQRPNKLHPDAISQCDLFISHRMTAKPDIDAVGALRPSYMHQDFDKYFAEMPRSKGFALIIDDNTEKIWMIKVRPRLSWDAGVTASAFLK